jgi:hypothetical protein
VAKQSPDFGMMVFPARTAGCQLRPDGLVQEDTLKKPPQGVWQSGLEGSQTQVTWRGTQFHEQVRSAVHFFGREYTDRSDAQLCPALVLADDRLQFDGRSDGRKRDACAVLRPDEAKNRSGCVSERQLQARCRGSGVQGAEQRVLTSDGVTRVGQQVCYAAQRFGIVCVTDRGRRNQMKVAHRTAS